MERGKSQRKKKRALKGCALTLDAETTFSALVAGVKVACMWMPAHTAEHEIAVARLSDGRLLSAEDRTHNAEADRLAKLAVEEDRLSASLKKQFLRHAGRVSDIAVWIGIATLAANNFEVWESLDGTLVKVTLRDAQDAPLLRRQPGPKRASSNLRRPVYAARRLAEEPRIAVERERMIARSAVIRPQGSSPVRAVTLSAAAVPGLSAGSASSGCVRRRHKQRRASLRPSVNAATVGAAASELPASVCSGLDSTEFSELTGSWFLEKSVGLDSMCAHAVVLRRPIFWF